MSELNKQLVLIYSIICFLLIIIEWICLIDIKNKKNLLLVLPISIIVFIAIYFIFIFMVSIGNKIFNDDILLSNIFANIPNIIIGYFTFLSIKDRIKKEKRKDV